MLCMHVVMLVCMLGCGVLCVPALSCWAAIGQVRTRHCRSSRARPTAFSAISVLCVLSLPLAYRGGNNLGGGGLIGLKLGGEIFGTGP